MRDELEKRLAEEFPFMRRGKSLTEQHEEGGIVDLYGAFGCECDDGWYQLLRDCCAEIVARYAEDGIGLDDIDLEITQIKEKYGTLRFYYGYIDAPCGIAAFDNLATGESIRFGPKTEGDIDDAIAKLRQDIHSIVRKAEEKSKYTCEVCGAEGKLRNDIDVGIRWIRTLCDPCHEDRVASHLSGLLTKQAMRERQTKGYVSVKCPKCNGVLEITMTPRGERTIISCPCRYIKSAEINL